VGNRVGLADRNSAITSVKRFRTVGAMASLFRRSAPLSGILVPAGNHQLGEFALNVPGLEFNGFPKNCAAARASPVAL
jgi:hypothetical protein